MKKQIIIDEYIKQTEKLLELFYNIYFREEWDLYWAEYRMIGDYKHWPWTVCIRDYYIDITDIFVALNEQIEEKVLFEWYEKNLDAHTEEKTFPNLYNYSKWKKK